MLVTISDRKIAVDDGTYTFGSNPGLQGQPDMPYVVKTNNTPDGVMDYYTADVVTAGDYYPFGMVMPGRRFAQAGKDYRYSINGQEKDKELNENITTALYWEYDSRIGRRWNVDPKPTVGVSAYATFFNNPISHIDALGDTGKPAAIPEPLYTNHKGKEWAIKKAFNMTGGEAKYEQRNPNGSIGSYVENVDLSKFFANNTKDKFQRYVRTNKQFVVTDESKIGDEQSLVNRLLGDFIWGNGPENIVFPLNGKFSNLIKNSIGVGEVLADWDKNDRTNGIYAWSMGLRGEINVNIHSGATSLEHFLGSITTRITKLNSAEILVEVFNVTSFTSGYPTKDIPIVNWFVDTPSSIVRTDGYDYYNNTSQYFSFTFNMQEITQKLKTYRPKGNE